MIPAEGMGRIIKNLNALQGLTKLGNLSRIEKDILLLQNSWQVLKYFYKKVLEQPLNATIQKFVGNKTFLSSQYVDTNGENIIRQFFITRENTLDFQGHFVSTIPLLLKHFSSRLFPSPSHYTTTIRHSRGLVFVIW